MLKLECRHPLPLVTSRRRAFNEIQMKFLESERLYLRKMNREDFPLFFHLDSDPVVMKYITTPRTEEEAKARMEKSFVQYEQTDKFGKWMAVEKATDRPIGWFVLTPLDGTEQIEIGYRLKEEFWGKGYATEMSKVIIDFGFNTVGLDRIVGVTHLENDASGNVLKKIGLKYIGQDKYYEIDVHFYELLKSDYISQ